MVFRSFRQIWKESEQTIVKFLDIVDEVAKLGVIDDRPSGFGDQCCASLSFFHAVL